MHISPAVDCESCTQKLLWCDQRIIAFTKIIQRQFIDCHVAVGYRDQADQHLAYTSGHSHDDWPASKHNCVDMGKPESLAVDFFMLGSDSHAYFLENYYQNIDNYYRLNPTLFIGYEITWGGEWAHLKDFDHFEIKT